MKLPYLLFFAILYLMKPATGFSQRSYSTEANLTIDNDAFLIAGIDRYYSSGIFAAVKRKTIAPSFFLKQLYKKDSLAREHYQYQFAHIFYTAYNPRWRNPSQFDRPYAGWIYLQSSWHGTGQKSSLRLSADLGLMGPATRIQPLQFWWHDIFGYRKPRGWAYQINNTPSIHLSMNYLRRLFYQPKTELYFETSNKAGTILTQSANGIAFRAGKMKPLTSSVWGSNRLWEKSNRQGMDELFFFIKETVRYRLYDATVEGNLIGVPSLYTKSIEPVLLHHYMGVAMAWPAFDLVLGHNITSKETPEARFHQYTTFDFFFRF